MVNVDKDVDVINDIATRRGVDFLRTAIGQFESEDKVLTIVSNGGLHPLPEDHIFGELYIASEGMLDFSSVESVNAEIDKIILNLKHKLLEKRWSKIFMIPFGHSVVSMNIKLAVFRVLRIETVDIFYFGEGKYGIIERDTRRYLSEI